MIRPVALALLAGGLLLTILGVQAMNAPRSELARFFTGAPTDRALWMLVGGLGALVERFRRFAPGDRYSQMRLLKFQRSLQNIPYYAFVLVDIDVDAGEADRVPLTGVRCAGAQTPLRPCG